MARTTPFIVLTNSRSGSAWLIDTLASHPTVSAHGELFHPHEHGVPTYGSADVPFFQTYLWACGAGARVTRPYHVARYLRKVFAHRPGQEAAGFKLQYAQAWAQPGLWPYLAFRRARVVHLVRENALDAVVSYATAKARGQFHPRRGDDVASATVTLDPEEVVERLEERELRLARGRTTVARFRLPALEVVYEELARGRDHVLARILEFLGARADVSLDSAFVRVNTHPSIESVENAGELRERLAATRFEWMLGGSSRP